MKIKDKVILITGASSGIGYKLAEMLSEQGAKLALIARRTVLMKSLALRLKPANPDVLVISADVTNRKAIDKAVKQILTKYKRIDIIINNAGVGYFGLLESMKLSDLEKVVKTNIFGLLNVTQAAIPHLKKSKGMIVNISSSLSKRALPFLSAYGGTKSMVDALSDGLRMELFQYGIKVLNYCPPETDTDFSKNALREGKSGSPLRGERKIAKVEDVSLNIIRSIQKNKREIVDIKIAKILNFFAPKFLDWLFYKTMLVKK